MKIKIYQTKGGGYGVQIKARNGRILLDAGGYNTARNAMASLSMVVKNITLGKFTITQPKPKK